MPFEEFVERGGRARFGFPAVTLMRSGSIGLNVAAYQALGEPGRVVLAYDREGRNIGVRTASKDESFAYPVRKASGDSWVVPGRAFFRYYDIVPEATAAYRAVKDGVYLVATMDAEPVHKSGRVSRRRREVISG